MYFIIECFQKSLFYKHKIATVLLFSSLAVFKTNMAIADESYVVSDRWKMSFGLKARGLLRTAGDSFNITDVPNQNSENQASSGAAFSSDFVSAKFGLDLDDLVSLRVRVDYFWQNPIIYNLFPKDYGQENFHLRDLYLLFPSLTNTSSFWFGRRSFEFENVYLFQAENPFDQIDLQGFGYENEVFQASISLNKETVFTTGKDNNGNQILGSNGKPALYSEDDYVVTAFVSGKFLLSEGKIFQPILSLRYYQGMPKDNESNSGIKKDAVSNASSFIVGGIFSRPLTDGLKGHTTVWFESLPADKSAQPNNNTMTSSYYGSGRIPPNYPQNTIGILDSSEFYFTPYGGLLTGVVLLNNTYASHLPVLRVANDEKSLVPDGSRTSRITNRLSVDLQPVYFFTKNWQLGLDMSLVYVSQKLISNDANSFVTTPILKYAFDEKLSTNKYFFVSFSYGIYEWKSKIFSDGSQTDKLFTTQSGINFML